MRIDISIVCNSYNHEKFISDAIEGFLAQEGDFTYEILVNDDASIDHTQEIIRSYEKRYPGLFRTWLHTENKYRKGIPFFNKVVIPSAEGRYIAYCEADDYWVSPHKLERQLEYLETHGEYSGCIHNCYVVDYEQDVVYLSEFNQTDSDKTLNDVVVQGGGLINPTASMFYRRSAMEGFYPQRPPVGDHFVMLRAATHGPLRWMAEPMSVYRRGVPGSDTARTRQRTPEQVHQFHERYIDALLQFQNSLSKDLRSSTDIAFQQRLNQQYRSLQNELVRVKQLNVPELLQSDADMLSKAIAVLDNVLNPSVYAGIYKIIKRHEARRSGRLVCNGTTTLPVEMLPLGNELQ